MKTAEGVTLLLLILLGQLASSVRRESLSWDEGNHIFAGYMAWKHKDHGLNPEHPPLVKMVCGEVLQRLERHGEARAAFERALPIARTMEPSAQETWIPDLQARIAAKQSERVLGRLRGGSSIVSA